MTEPAGPPEPIPAVDPVAASMVTLRDGSRVAVVPMQPTDSVRLMRFHATLSPETTYSRFFSVHPELSSKELHRFTHVDHHDREAIVALADDEIVAVARFDLLNATDAEVAFVVADSWQGRGIGSLLLGRLARRATEIGVVRFVADSWQGRGIGSLLLGRLARRATEIGVVRFVADTLPTNQRMLTVFRHADLPIWERIEEGVVHLTLSLNRDLGPVEG